MSKDSLRAKPKSIGIIMTNSVDPGHREVSTGQSFDMCKYGLKNTIFLVWCGCKLKPTLAGLKPTPAGLKLPEQSDQIFLI